MNQAMISQYIKLTEFLGTVLGPDYEVALHDLSDPDSSIIAIANGHISGRTIGAQLTETARRALEEQLYRTEDFRANYSGIAEATGTMLRSSTFCIKDENDVPQGLLCINFDDSRYRDLSDQLLKLRHPDAFVDTNFVYNKEKARRESSPGANAESFHESASSLAEATIAHAVERSGVPVDRLTLDEKMAVIADLDDKGVFLLKNAVRQVAELLHCSQATVYRYIGKLHNGE